MTDVVARVAYVLACAGSLAIPIATLHGAAVIEGRPVAMSLHAVGVTVVAAALSGAALGAAALIAAMTKRDRGPGWNRARAAVIVGVLSAVSGQVIGDAFGRSLITHQSEPLLCELNLRALMVAMSTYSQDNDDRLPLSADWNVSVVPNTRNGFVLRCPAAFGGTRPTYATNSALSGLKASSVDNAPQLPCLFDSRPGRDLAGGAELLPRPPRHNGKHVVLFLDSHAKSILPSGVGALQWHPAVHPGK